MSCGSTGFRVDWHKLPQVRWFRLEPPILSKIHRGAGAIKPWKPQVWPLIFWSMTTSMPWSPPANLGIGFEWIRLSSFLKPTGLILRRGPLWTLSDWGTAVFRRRANTTRPGGGAEKHLRFEPGSSAVRPAPVQVTVPASSRWASILFLGLNNPRTPGVSHAWLLGRTFQAQRLGLFSLVQRTRGELDLHAFQPSSRGRAHGQLAWHHPRTRLGGLAMLDEC